MNTLIRHSSETSNVINNWRYVEPFAKVPNTKADYQTQRKLLDKLMKLTRHNKNKHISTLLYLIARNLEIFEEQHFPLEHSNPIDILKFLMKEHGLTQSDLSEIGSQSLVSKILKGERNLTADQIGQLAKRFHVSPAVFFN